jgi:inner membrane protein
LNLGLFTRARAGSNHMEERSVADSLSGTINSVRHSRLLRVLLIGFLVLLLQIPILMIEGQIGDRTATRGQAVEEVTGKWGKEQTVMGPVLVVPYTARWEEEEKPGKKTTRTAVQSASFLAEDLRIEGKLDSEVRRRGIFGVPVYRLAVQAKGRFLPPDFSDWGIAASDIQWDRAELWVRISDARAIQNQAALTWNGAEIPFAPGLGDFGGAGTGIHVPLKGRMAGAGYEFSFALTLNGSMGAFFAPLGRGTTVTLDSNWISPSFQGNWLPTDRKVRPDGFEAKWIIPSLGRNYPQKWAAAGSVMEEMEKSRFGVNLFTPIDLYRMCERSVKYEALFLLMTFLTLWMFEVLARRRIHSLQYLLVGAAMCLFYLLLLSLSEHAGFLSAYLLASLMVAGLITAYCASVLRSARRALVVGGIVAALYFYLYILLNNEDYALVIGSLGLFLLLATVMFLTRKTDWYEAPEPQEPERKPMSPPPMSQG